MAHWFTQLIALSDGIVWLWAPNQRSVAASSHFDFGLILHEINAIEQNTVGSMPNEAIAEENQNQKIPCEGHYCEGTLKRPSTPIRKQMVCSVTHWMAVSIITLNLVFGSVFPHRNTIALKGIENETWRGIYIMCWRALCSPSILWRVMKHAWNHKYKR